MKTTVQISDSLLDEARALAQREQTTLKALVEEGLRRLIEERSGPVAFRLRDASVDGQGIRPELASASWSELRDMSYEGRGG